MNRTARRLAVALCTIAVVPLAATSSPAGAIDQDLVVSAASGAPGTVVEVSSASCAPLGEDVDGEQYVRVLLVSGTGDAAVLAGAGSGQGAARFIVPDWVDPAEPAVIEASCVTVEYGWDDDTVTRFAFDPVAFDVLAGSGSPTQSRTFSRTSLLTGQSFAVDGTGCGTTGDDFAGVDLLAGDDPTGRSLDRLVADGGDLTDGGSFAVQVDLIDRSWGVGWSSDDAGNVSDISIQEGATDIPAGAYTALTYCGTYDESTNESAYLILPPQIVDVTGSAPIDDLDFKAAAGSSDGVLAGGECTSGDVNGEIMGDDLADDSFDLLRRSVDDAVPSPLGLRTHGAEAEAATRAIGDDDWVEFTATPAADGSWDHTESASFAVGILAGIATCGDPLADGFAYDVRLAVVDVQATSTTTTTTVTTTVPAATPAPAAAVAGSPTYAG
jgi:hypothetical protein